MNPYERAGAEGYWTQRPNPYNPEQRPLASTLWNWGHEAASKVDPDVQRAGYHSGGKCNPYSPQRRPFDHLAWRRGAACSGLKAQK